MRYTIACYIEMCYNGTRLSLIHYQCCVHKKDSILAWIWTALMVRQRASILTHWGRVTHICVGKLTIIGSDNSLSPGRRQAIIWSNAGILLIGPLGTNLSEILIEIPTILIQENAFESVVCEMASICLGLNVLNRTATNCMILKTGSQLEGKKYIKEIKPCKLKENLRYCQTSNISAP